MNADPMAVGAFLRARRATISPHEVGLGTTGRRRTTGLRREEVATLAGVSIDYLTRLERGRHPAPSAEVLAALAAALGLSTDERAHLFSLAGRANPVPIEVGRADVPPSLRRTLARLDPDPAWLLNRRRDIVAWNFGAEALLGSWLTTTGVPNLLHHTFCDTSARRLWADWELVAFDAVAQVRAILAEAGHHPDVDALVAELAERSSEFADLWARQDVRRACSPTRAIDHHAAGALRVDVSLLDVDGGDLQLVLLTPADQASDRRWADHCALAARQKIHAV